MPPTDDASGFELFFDSYDGSFEFYGSAGEVAADDYCITYFSNSAGTDDNAGGYDPVLPSSAVFVAIDGAVDEVCEIELPISFLIAMVVDGLPGEGTATVSREVLHARSGEVWSAESFAVSESSNFDDAVAVVEAAYLAALPSGAGPPAVVGLRPSWQAG